MDQFYQSALQSMGFKPRQSQQKMYQLVLATLSKATSIDVDTQGPVSVIEASTGTGKTFAYTLAALNALRHSKKKIIISTATIALQEQLVHQDLPQLRQHTGIDFNYVLAKGRGRYICLDKLNKLINANGHPLQGELFGVDIKLKQAQGFYQQLKTSMDNNQWDGDRDQLSEFVAKDIWQPVTATHLECSNRHCPSFDRCIFFKRRQGLMQADIIVANHDLVLSDLQLGGGAILPMPEESVYIFDEGHHLIEKARNRFQTASQTNTCNHLLELLLKSLNSMNKQLKSEYGLEEQLLQVLPALTSVLRQDLELTLTGLHHYFTRYVPGEHKILRFVNGFVPEDFKALIDPFARKLRELYIQLEEVYNKIKALHEDGYSEVEPLSQRLGYFLGQLAHHNTTYSDFAFTLLDDQKPPIVKARWLHKIDDHNIELISTPIIAAELLQSALWSRCAGAVVTSATLSLANEFDYFLKHSGINQPFACAQLPYAFDYKHQAVLNLFKHQFDPSNRLAHCQSIINYLPQCFRAAKGGVLVLFSSWQLLNEVRDALSEEWQQVILAQGDRPQKELITLHKKHIDQNDLSVIFGVQSFYEGIDLPHQYCRHVIITKIPFANPDEPITKTLEEYIKFNRGNPFKELMLPQAALKLVQASGRLIRNHDDFGEITVLDQRLLTKQYGKALLDSLPPYQRNIL